jgi:hypothetical protein
MAMPASVAASWQLLWTLFQRLWSNPSPCVGGILGGLLTGGVFGYMAHLRNTRPILVFFRRPDSMWRLRNIGRGAAFDVVFTDQDGKGRSSSFILYPMSDGEEKPLGTLKYGEALSVHYQGWFRPWRYTTTCRMWRNKVSISFRRPSMEGLLDETRLNHPAPAIPDVRIHSSDDY